MKDLQTRVFEAAQHFIANRGGKIIETDPVTSTIIFVDDEGLAFADVHINDSDSAFPDNSNPSAECRSEREQYCMNFLQKTEEDYAGHAVRFDRLDFKIFGDKAFTRYQTNYLGLAVA